MTDQPNSPRRAALQELEAAWEQHRRDQTGCPASEAAPPEERRSPLGWRGWRLPFNPWFLLDRRHPVIRGVSIAIAAVIALFVISAGALWWRLSTGPIGLDLATPWLTSAIEANFGSRYRVQVGGTQLERDANGRTAIRLRDLVVRDAQGAVVAMAPKAEVGIAGTSLLIASPRAESFRLVDASVLIRIDSEGRINVFAGGEKPFATFAPVGASPLVQGQAPTFSLQAISQRNLAMNFAALLAWMDGLGDRGREGTLSGFDGADLAEIGITNASLTIDDERNGDEWKLTQISVNLTRPRAGGAALSVVSENQQRSWLVNLALTPRRLGHRFVQLDARKVLLDDLLALRMTDGRLRSDTLVSASVEAEIAADGTPQVIGGTIVAEGGSIGESSDPRATIPIGTAEFGLDWDISRRTLRVPFKITSGASRITLRSEFAAPAEAGGNWMFAIGGGWIVLGPLTRDDDGLILKRVVVRGSIDTNKQKIALEQADIGTRELGSHEVNDVSVAMSGEIDFGPDGRLALGIAGNQMTAASLKRLWPTFIAPTLREWVVHNVVSGKVERADVATNIPLASLPPGGPPIAEEALSVNIVGSAVAVRPVEGLPPIRDADLNVRVTGRNAIITMGKGNIDVSPGRRLALTGGVFEVPDTRPEAPPARVRFRLEGPVPAAVELLALERLRDFSGAPFDPGSTRGTLNAQVNLSLPRLRDLPKGATTYNIAVDVTNFSAEKMLFGQKVEAAALRVIANNQNYQIKGDVKVNGTPAQIEYRKVAAEPDAELRMQATLDEAARGRLGFDLGQAVNGPLPVKVNGRVGPDDKESRFNIEADLTPVKVDNLLPGWVKPPGKLARAVFTLVKEKGAMRFDDLLIDGQGIVVKGNVELDANNELLAANFPVFATSDGDKATVKADRGPDGALRVTMRADVYDGRNFVKSSMAGPPADPRAKPKHPDLDIDIRIGVMAGHNGETVRGLDLRMSRRAGRVRTFLFNAKIGRDTPLLGEMRTRIANNRQVLYFETNDAGALFRFTDVYPRMLGGRMWVGMDPPSLDQSPQEGLINVRDFAIRGEGALDRVVSGAQNNGRGQIEFTQARADFTRHGGRLYIRDGLVRGPTIGATIEGQIDYTRDEVSTRGTLVPLYGINNMFGQIPIVGLFLGGGSNEGLLGITYEVTGPVGNPRLQVNPISAIAPGLLRKFFEFRDNSDRERAFADPSTR
jgi:hypothetical protein